MYKYDTREACADQRRGNTYVLHAYIAYTYTHIPTCVQAWHKRSLCWLQEGASILRIYMSMHTYIHIHTHTYIYTCVQTWHKRSLCWLEKAQAIGSKFWNSYHNTYAACVCLCIYVCVCKYAYLYVYFRLSSDLEPILELLPRNTAVHAYVYPCMSVCVRKYLSAHVYVCVCVYTCTLLIGWEQIPNPSA
jgi:hypothetical protein